MSDKRYPSNLYLESVTTSVDFASHVSVEAVIVMAKELLALRKSSLMPSELTAENGAKAALMGEWRLRAEAAEAKLAELGASVPVYQYESAIYNEENGDTDWYWDDCDKGFYVQYDPSRRRILFTRPAPAADLAPVSNCLSFFASVIKSGESWSATCQRDLDAARRALRDAEEAK